MRQTKKYSMLVFLSFFLLAMVKQTSSRPPHPPATLSNKHFVLVHGACHGAWTWYKLAPLLRSSGHNVTAIDLAASGIDPQQVNTLQSMSDYTRPLRDLMASLSPNERVILVGHSLGGLAISQAMERFPKKISVAVFVCAVMPGPSLNISTLNQELLNRNVPQLDTRYSFDNGPNNPPTSYILGPISLALRLYQLSPIEDWTLATTLTRATRQFSDENLSRELSLTSKNYGSVKRVFIIAEKDLTLEKGIQEWMIQQNPPNEAEEILGSDHMPMMSKTKELWVHLLGIAHKYI